MPAAVFPFIELINREQLDAVDAKLFQVRNLFPQSSKRTGSGHFRRFVSGETTDMRLVDDEILDRGLERMIVFPIEVIEREAGPVLIGIVPVRLNAPCITTADYTRVRI